MVSNQQSFLFSICWGPNIGYCAEAQNGRVRNLQVDGQLITQGGLTHKWFMGSWGKLLRIDAKAVAQLVWLCHTDQP